MNLREKLKKSRFALSRKLGEVFGKGLDENTLELAEEILLASDRSIASLSCSCFDAGRVIS